jgi:serine/threonine protein kinase
MRSPVEAGIGSVSYVSAGIYRGNTRRMEAGRVLGGRYRIVEQIGGGGSAVVWRGYDQLLNRHVAIKVLSGPTATGPQARDRIHDEARMAAALSHPHIAQIHDVGESVDDGQETPYVVMELVDGPTVEQIGPLTVPQVLRLGAEVASALAAAHAIGLVHRDIKPANIIITASGAKVVDFGIAAPARVGGPAEPGSQLLGTPAYVAPERLTHDGVEPASDVYSLGVLLYRLLTCHLPWTAESTEQMLTDQVYVEPAPLPARAGLTPAVVDLCTACLAKNPADRPPAALLAHTLAAAAAQPTSGTPDAAAGRAPRSRAPNPFPCPASWSTDLGWKQSPSLGQATAARVIRSCSRCCPPPSIVPNPAAGLATNTTQLMKTTEASSPDPRFSRIGSLSPTGPSAPGKATTRPTVLIEDRPPSRVAGTAGEQIDDRTVSKRVWL